MFAKATVEQLARVDEILGQLDQSQGPDPNDNRRRAKRMNLRTAMVALVLSGTGNASLTIFSRDLSTSGIGFLCRRSCKAGERLALSFDLPNRHHKLVLAQITFCRYVRAGLYQAGAEFMDSVTGGDSHECVPPHWIPSLHSPATIAAPPRVPAPPVPLKG